MKSPLRILHLEDDPPEVALAQAALDAEGIPCVSTCVETRADFAAALERGNFDLILSDFSMPAFDGLSALELALSRCPDVPFILVSGTLGEERAVDSLQRGATDYVLKQRLSRLVPAVRRAMQEVKERRRRRLAEAKQKEYARKLEALSRRLVEAQESERRSIARELHDEIGQALTLMQLNLQAVLQSPLNAGQARRAHETLSVLGRVLQQVHALALNLRPSILDDLGLDPALKWLTERQATLGGLNGEVQAEVLEHRLETVIETACFRVAQEALTNVVRHARANTVAVELRSDKAQLHLRVRDDGLGFDVSAVRARAVRGESLGLLSMEERAVLVGGGLDIKSTSGKGTEVHAWFPLNWQTPSTGGGRRGRR